jgi:Chlamydia CHLPS protein (DUF818)
MGLEIYQPTSIPLDPKGTFHASYPKYWNQDSIIKKISALVYNILSVIIFPIGLLRLTSRKIHTFLGYYFFVPSQSYSKMHNIFFYDLTTVTPLKEEVQKKYLQKGVRNLKEKYRAKKVKLITPDKVKIQGIFIPGRDKYGKELKQDGPLIIYFLGQYGRYEDLGHYDESLQSVTNYNILVFNDRGVIKSDGIATKKGLFLDAETQYQFARRVLKVPKDKIVLVGHSFGGIKAMYLAARHNIKVIYDRFFGSVTKATYYLAKSFFQVYFSSILIMPFLMFAKMSGKSISDKFEHSLDKNKIFINNRIVRPKILVKIINFISIIFAYFISKLPVLSDWEFDAALLWNKVRGKKVIIYYPKDETIIKYASLFKAVHKTKDEFICIDDENFSHCAPLSKKFFTKALNMVSGLSSA